MGTPASTCPHSLEIITRCVGSGCAGADRDLGAGEEEDDQHQEQEPEEVVELHQAFGG